MMEKMNIVTTCTVYGVLGDLRVLVGACVITTAVVVVVAVAFEQELATSF